MTKPVFDTATALQHAAAMEAQMVWPWDDRDRKRAPLRTGAGV
jgi:hypothetical protein